MLLLVAFALIAGAGTALSPCVLPILPVVLSAGVTGGRRRPLGIVVGLALSFTFTVVVLVYVIDALGLPNDIQRTIAIVVLAGFGISLIVPAIGDRIEATLSRFVGRPRMAQGEGFGSGLLLGAGLGLVYVPCAGPILAGVITVSASQELTFGRFAVALAYAIGSAVVLYVLLLGGRRLIDRLKPAQGRIQAATGAIMVLAAIVMATSLDRDFEQSIATGLPDFVTNPTSGIENSDDVAARIYAARGGTGHPVAVQGGEEQADAGSRLPVLGPAPDITDPGEFFNTANGEPVSISKLTAEGKTVLVDFWTYTCINCIRTLPHVEAWYQRYADEGLVVIGVHTPEFPFERDASNVADAIASNHLTYPVVQDNDLGTWNAFANQYWPAKYLIDSSGRIRYAHFGEGDYGTTEDAIRSLLAENGNVGARAKQVKAEVADPALQTPETYLGAARALGWVQDPLRSGSKDFGDPQRPPGLNEFAYSGGWDIGDEDARSLGDARIDVTFKARRVFLVLGSPQRTRHVKVLLDGKPIAAGDAGEDVHDGTVDVNAQRLYSLVDLPAAGSHTLTLEFDKGIAGYAFTFG
jgi:cytochrome c biogenesis protein CcdA/thiol-disulfide isomerase/thioredoxin